MTLPARYILPFFLLIVFLGPMVLGPLLNLALQPFGIPFHRVMSRALLISALAGLLLFRSRLSLNTWWRRGPIIWRHIALGLLVAIVSAAAMIVLYFGLCGFHVASISSARAVHVLIIALVASIIVPLLEETIFRGFLITILAEAVGGKRMGCFLGAILFSLAHFLKIPPEDAGMPVHWWSGATGILSIFSNLGHGGFFSGSGLNLFLIGLVLGEFFLRVGTLWISAALHGGWIFILMTFTALTHPVTPPYIRWLGSDLLSSPLTALVLLGLILWAGNTDRVRLGSSSMV